MSINHYINRIKIFLCLQMFILLWTPFIQADGLDKVRLQLQWKHQFEFAGFYAAKEKGYYANAGLEVELIEFDTGMDPTERVLNRDVQFAVGYSSIISQYLEGKPIVLLANFFKYSPIAIVAQPHIKTPKDLIGKKVMGISDSVGDITLLMMLDKFGMNPDSIVNVPPNYAVDDFVNGSVDAMVVFTTNEIFQIEAAGKKYNLFDPTVYGAEYYDVNLFTSQAELKKDPSRVKRFRDASIKGWEYALRNQSEIINLIRVKYNTQNKSQEGLAFEAKQIWNIMMPKVHAIGSIDEQRLNMIGSDLIQLGILPDDTVLDYKNFIYKEPLKAPELTEAEQQYLNDKGTITFCVDPRWMPFEEINNGAHVGMSADYIKIFQDKIHTPFKLVPTQSWEESLDFAKQRKCDILSLIMPTPARRVFMNFTSPYLSYPLVIATRTDSLFILDITEVMDKPLGIVKGYAFVEILRRKYPGINLVEVASLEEGLDQVAKGNLYGYIDSLGTIGYILQKKYIGELKIAGKFHENWELGIGVRNDDPVLLGILEKLVKGITPVQHQKIANKWISVTFEKGVDYDLVWKISIASLISLCLFALYSWQVRKRNQQIFLKNNQLEKIGDLLRQNNSKLEEKNKEIQGALDEIKILRGILPICSFCKNIRNDEGYYERIEAYIHKHSGVDFSHTICPECMKKHYPEEHTLINKQIT